MSPKIVDKDQRQREIAAAALEVIAEHGFEGISISQIAEVAGISKGTIYVYFESKADLTIAAARTWIEAIEAGVEPLLDASPDPLTRLRTLFRASTRAFLEDQRMIMLFLGMAQLALRDRELFEGFDVAGEVSAPIRKAICGILLDGVAQGIFRPEVENNAEQIAINLVAFVDGLGLHYVSNPDAFDLSAQVDLYLEGLLHSLEKQ